MRLSIILLIIGLILLILVPLIAPVFILRILILTLFFVVLTEGLNLVTGYADLVSLGQVVFLGIGGYTSVLLFLTMGVSPYLGMIAGMLISAVTAVGFGYVAAKIRGIYFAMGTVGLAQLATIIALNWKATGGSIGLGWEVRNAPLDFQFTSVVPYYYIILAMAAASVVLVYIILRTGWGYRLRAIGSNESASEAVGINTTRMKVEAFVISAVLTSAAGTFYAEYLAYVNPTTFFTIDTTIELFVILAIGGAATVLGPVLGAFLLIPIYQLTVIYLGPVAGSLDVAVYSAFLVFFVLFYPNGLISIFARGGRRRKALLSTERIATIFRRPKRA